MSTDRLDAVALWLRANRYRNIYLSRSMNQVEYFPRTHLNNRYLVYIVIDRVRQAYPPSIIVRHWFLGN